MMVLVFNYVIAIVARNYMTLGMQTTNGCVAITLCINISLIFYAI